MRLRRARVRPDPARARRLAQPPAGPRRGTRPTPSAVSPLPAPCGPPEATEPVSMPAIRKVLPVLPLRPPRPHRHQRLLHVLRHAPASGKKTRQLLSPHCTPV
jgi:hypothetical protein